MNKFNLSSALTYLGFFALIAFAIYYTNSIYPLCSLGLLLFDIFPTKK